MGHNVLRKRKNEILVLFTSSVIMLTLIFVLPSIEKLNDDYISIELGQESNKTYRENFSDSLITLNVLSDVWYPYCGESGTKNEGYIINILRVIFEKEGYRINYQNRPWARCIEEVRAGSAHALAGCTYEEVKEFEIPTENIGYYTNVFFVLDNSKFVFNGISSLLGERLGIIQNYGYAPSINTYADTLTNQENLVFSRGENPLGSMILGLLAERVSVVKKKKITFLYTSKLMGYKENTFKEVGALNDVYDLLVAFSPNKPESKKLRQIFDKRIKEMRKSGELKLILDKYQIPDWKLR